MIKEFMQINNLLIEKLQNEPFLIVAHRGTALGNIIENTIPSLIAACQSGADIVEIDVVQSSDGQFYLFHDGNENRLLGEKRNIKQLSSAEIETLHYYNSIRHKINYQVEKLEDLLKYVKGTDYLINIDRSWAYWDRLLPYLDSFNLENHILLKSPVKDLYLQQLEKHPTKYMYFPIVKSLDDLEIIRECKNVNIVGVEIIAENQDSPFFQDELIESLRNEYHFVFANAIRLDDKEVLFGELDDDLSILKGPEYGWRKVVEKGCNVLQTDWTGLLDQYRQKEREALSRIN
ncbi:glycerophosphodiester phosphodiesterase family protein [Bacillus sp. SD088]|uniref:glycerophosphodiester phosphodiesterase family protein n=1 Tax=Bacillus sp. SD088 TaxID=2782012 RepID=UPI001A95871F|nr:glycerophosphodiester phosphodiesterase family protein [Bacillus sp. SD088]MBO0991869.1 glycerophosphodiester phosphodiesterase family protein [Bacillus sp. SD088]